MKRHLAMWGAIAALCTVRPASAEMLSEGPYIGLGGGWSSLDPVKFNIGASIGPISGKSSFTGNAAVNAVAGYRLSSLPIRLEAEAEYTDFDAKRLEFPALPIAASASGDLGVTSFFANALYDYSLSQHFALTVGGGAGAALADANLSNAIGAAIVKAGTGFTWQGLAGITVVLSDRFQIETDYRYQSIDSTGHEFLSLGASGNASLRSKDIQSVMLNLRWFVNPFESP